MYYNSIVASNFEREGVIPLNHETQVIRWIWKPDADASNFRADPITLVVIKDLCEDSKSHKIVFDLNFNRPVGRCSECGLPLAQKPGN